MSSGKVYLIGTPIGNVQDITRRAVSVFATLRHLFAEDTREAERLFELVGVPRGQCQFHSFASHNMKDAVDKALAVLEMGEDVGLISDRGMPALSDPGYLLVAAARSSGHLVVPIPGPSSITTALAVSGVSTDQFVFLGFLSTKQEAKRSSLQAAAQLNLPICFFESPKRIVSTLAELAEWFPRGRVFLAREMTKVFESFLWLDFSSPDWKKVEFPDKGEFTCVLQPEMITQTPEEKSAVLKQQIELRLSSDKDWAKQVAETFNLSARDLYNRLQDAKRHNC